jgi:hypothetical protein
VTYQFLHYLIGLRRLGYDPYYVEDSGRWIYDPRLNDLSPDATYNVSVIAPVLERFGFAGRWFFRGNYPDGQCYGLSEETLDILYRDADAFLNVTGAQEIRPEHLRCPKKIYLETDPVASQIRVAQGDPATISLLEAHDLHFSFGENFGAPDCKVPLARFEWQPTRQPVITDLWNRLDGSAGDVYTTIGNWHSKGKEITYDNQTYHWSKDREFLKLMDLPLKCSVPFELATNVSAEQKKLLATNHWRVTDGTEISNNIDAYRAYIRQSRGEFTVAKDQNIRLRSGWFSDRGACYLAAGRPVVNQETGFSAVLPTGRGLFPFETMDDILAAVGSIEADYEGNCRAAREIAEEYFRAEKVLASLLERAGL